MPKYLFRNKKTKKQWYAWMSITERTNFLKRNKHVEQLIDGAPSLVDPVRVGRKKPDAGFRDLLGQIKKNNKGSKINTYGK